MELIAKRTPFDRGQVEPLRDLGLLRDDGLLQGRQLAGHHDRLPREDLLQRVELALDPLEHLRFRQNFARR